MVLSLTCPLSMYHWYQGRVLGVCCSVGDCNARRCPLPPAYPYLQELCEGGNWFQRLIEHGTYSESQAAETIRTLLKTLQYCHSVGVVHRWGGREGAGWQAGGGGRVDGQASSGGEADAGQVGRRGVQGSGGSAGQVGRHVWCHWEEGRGQVSRQVGRGGRDLILRTGDLS